MRIADGDYTIKAGKDGIHAENADDASLGFLYIAGGDFQIVSDGDGVSAASDLQIDDGSFDITAGGGSENGAGQDSQDSWQSFGPGGPGSVSQEETASDSEDSVSTKGIKASVSLIVNGGSFSIDSADDAFHSNGDLGVAGGTLRIASGDDGHPWGQRCADRRR